MEILETQISNTPGKMASMPAKVTACRFYICVFGTWNTLLPSSFACSTNVHAPILGSPSVPSKPKSGTACPQCGLIKKSGKLSCCAPGGAWVNNCGGPGDSQFDHTWTDGMKSCKGALRSKLLHNEQFVTTVGVQTTQMQKQIGDSIADAVTDAALEEGCEALVTIMSLISLVLTRVIGF